MQAHPPQLPAKKTDTQTTGRRSPLPASAATSSATRVANGGHQLASAGPVVTDLQRAFLARRTDILSGIDKSRSLLADLKAAPSRGFLAQYPLGTRYPAGFGTLSKLPIGDTTGFGSQATLAPVTSQKKDNISSWSSPTTPATASTPADEVPGDGSLLKVLGIDVKSNGKQSTSLIESLESSSVANLLQEKLTEAASYLDRLFKRVSDTSSKVFVTGDLNAGKSTFVNALLRREIVPQDQQPCTTHFCEVVDANQNDGKEEVHAIRDPEKYDRTNPATFDRYDIRHLPMMVTENAEKNDYNLFKVYCNDQRPATESLIKNGLVDISLIDSPGLNIDSLKTTANFAKQEDIDVIVFMVHAENQFTLSVGFFFLALR